MRPSGWEPRFSREDRERPRSPTGKSRYVIETTSIMFDVGVIASVGFIGAALASRVRIPIIIGYIIAGFVIGAWLGWPVIDTIFMAGVIGMSSSAIAAKSLIDLKRLGNRETEFILGMVILESFLAMFILTLANGMILPAEGPVNIGGLFAGVGLFIGFFALLAAVVPRTAAIFERIKSEELFVLFALGTVFLAAALAEAFRIAAIVGAFFMGMVFADTHLAGRLKVKMESLRDAFVAIFFLSFGMLIDPSSFS